MYDTILGRFPSLDPKAEEFSFVSPYNYAENRPIEGIDLWGLQHMDYRKFNSLTASTNKSEANKITEQRVETTQKVIETVKEVDYIGVSFDGDAIVGGGTGYTISIGYVKDDGLLINFAPKTGSGADVSAAISLEVGFHNEKTKNEKASGENIKGVSSYESFSVSFLTFSSSQDISKDKDGKPKIGKNWQFYSVGVTVGSSDIIQGAGSVGVEYTTPPLYLFRHGEEENQIQKKKDDVGK
jgi:hypothetical protein